MKNDMFSTVSLSAARMARRALAMVAAAVVTGATLTPAFATLNTHSWDDDDQRVMWKYSSETAWKTVEVRECASFGEESFPAALTMPSCLLTGYDWCGVGGIGDYAFQDNTELQSITIPWVNYIDSGAFSGCTSLSSVTFLGPVPAGLDFNGVFENTPFLARITQENANDFAESAREIEGASGNITDTNYLATPNDIVENEGAVEPLKGLASWLVGTKWYRWTAPATTTAWFDTYGSDFNTVLGVYEMNANDVQAFTVEAVKGENDDYGGLSSLVSFSAVQGRTYWICVGGEAEEVDGMSRPRGNIALNWRTGTAVKLTLSTGLKGKNKKVITMTAYVPKAKAVGVLPAPDRTGHVFLGWYSKAVGGTRITPTSKFNKATKLYAHWSPRSFRLSVKPDKETEKGCKSVTGGGLYAHGKKVTITATAKDGYKFGMWNAPEYGPTENEFKNYYRLCRKNTAATVTVYGRNMWYEACFVSEADDYMELDVEDDYGAPDLITTWYADETKSVAIYLQAKSKTYPTVTTTKLPSGVTFKLSEDGSADSGAIERRDARYLLSVPDTSKLAPGKHTITVTAKNRWGQIATKELVIFGKNKTAANAWLPGIVTAVTSAAAPYRMTVGILPEWNDFGISPAAGVAIAKMAGLPSGVAWDAKKQRFTGYPKKAGMYAVTITASKKVGKKTVSKASTILVEVEKPPTAG